MAILIPFDAEKGRFTTFGDIYDKKKFPTWKFSKREKSLEVSL